MEVDYALAAINLFLSPRQLHLLIDAVSAIPEPGWWVHFPHNNSIIIDFRLAHEGYFKYNIVA